MKTYLIARLKEPSTWRGLVLIATACGAVLSPDQMETIVTGGMMVVGLIGALTSDTKSGDLIARLKDPSTWRGLVMIATACGAALSPEQWEAIVTGGLMVVGLIGASISDTKSGE